MARRLALLLTACGLAAAAFATAGPAAATTTTTTSTSAHHERASATSRNHRRKAARRLRRITRPRRHNGHVPAFALLAGPLGDTLVAPVPGGGVPSPPVPGPPVPIDPGVPPPPACKSSIGAIEREWSIMSTSPSSKLCAGAVTIHAQNYGADEHDLWIRDDHGFTRKVSDPATNVPPLSGGVPGQQTGTVTLAPGTYKLFCSLIAGAAPAPSHEAAGMLTTVTVVAAD